jgi:nicotinate phosphoribosyltransferase
MRLDGGDLTRWPLRCNVADAAGLQKIGLFAGELDESGMQSLVAGGAPIDGFGVGTSLDVASDCPALDCAYKLQEYAGRPRRKRSPGKAHWPGAKQVYRQRDALGELDHDVVAPAAEEHRGEPLLKPCRRGGLHALPCSRRAASTWRVSPPANAAALVLPEGRIESTSLRPEALAAGSIRVSLKGIAEPKPGTDRRRRAADFLPGGTPAGRRRLNLSARGAMESGCFPMPWRRRMASACHAREPRRTRA